jgi:N-acetylmuramoyl-L-alanine amidase
MSSLKHIAGAMIFALMGHAALAFTVVIDPGHGGRDPGAEAHGLREADLVLSMAERLAAELQGPDVSVVLTRRDDSFVSLDERVEIARAAGADVLLSIHADSLEDGGAAGLSVYSFDPSRGDWADAARRAEVPVADWLTGVPAEGLDEETGAVLMRLARDRTGPRSALLSAALARSFREHGLRLAGRPERRKGFVVLRAPEIPSVLIELGFLSSDRDRARLTSADWQARAVAAIAAAITEWRIDAGENFDG